jgi:hypothetical protein
MRTRRMAPWLLCLLVGTFWQPKAGLGQPGPTPTPDPKFMIRGRWQIDFNRQDGFLRLTRDPGKGQKARGPDPNPFRLGDTGLQRPSDSAKVPVKFQIHRDAGDFEFEGQANASEGDGRFVFNADDDFPGDPNLDQLWGMALYDVDFNFLRNLLGVGMGKGLAQNPTPEQLIAMKTYGIDSDFILGLKGIGYSNVPIPDLILLRKNGGTLEYARKMRAEHPSMSIQELARQKPAAK